ncbi:MAG: ORF6N domain-containing protein [bacterium]
MSDLVPVEIIAGKIFLIREQKVMLDRDLAGLYAVEVKYLKRQVKRNNERFPEDFMFQLSKEEFENWRCQFVTSKSDKMGLRYRPFAFTEHGILMLSSVLNSKRAITVNIQIMRTFAQMRQMMLSYKDLKEKIEKIESKYDKQFRIVFQALKQLLEPKPVPPKRKIGF